MGPLSMSRKQWYEEIWKLSASGTAKKHDIPYGPFMQQIKASGIPIPPPGYWTKINFEKPVKVIPLPGDPEEILTIYQAFPKRKSEKQPTPEVPAEAKSDTPATAATVAPETSIAPLEVSERVPASICSEPTGNLMQKKQGRDIYNRVSLYCNVWKYSIEDAANLYNVTVATLEKVCKAIDIPLPQKRDSEKLRTGQKIEKQPPLPERNPSPRAIDPQTGYQSKIR